MSWLRSLLILVCAAIFAAPSVRAAETIPPAPTAYFNDYGQATDPATAATLNGELDQFERTTSNQIVVAIYPKMESDSSVEDFTVRTAQAWHAGQKGRDNGLILFVFVESHQLRIQVGYGLEGAVSDKVAKDIIRDVITPPLRAGDFSKGMADGVHALMSAARGEYQGSGQTANDERGSTGLPKPFLVLIVLGFFLLRWVLNRRGTVYRSSGRRGVVGPWIFPGGGSGNGGGFDGGSGGGGGFSGGGGNFGGGGAGGSW